MLKVVKFIHFSLLSFENDTIYTYRG